MLFDHSSQYTCTHWLSSCSNETHQTSATSRNCLRFVHWLIVSLWILRYHMKQSEYFSCELAHQYWCSDCDGWDSYFLHLMCSQDWNQYWITSCRCQNWMSRWLQALWPQGLVEGLKTVLGVIQMELSGLLKDSGELKLISTIDTTLIIYWYCQERHSVPYSPIRKGYSWTKLSPATTQQWLQ